MNERGKDAFSLWEEKVTLALTAKKRASEVQAHGLHSSAEATPLGVMLVWSLAVIVASSMSEVVALVAFRVAAMRVKAVVPEIMLAVSSTGTHRYCTIEGQ